MAKCLSQASSITTLELSCFATIEQSATRVLHCAALFFCLIVLLGNAHVKKISHLTFRFRLHWTFPTGDTEATRSSAKLDFCDRILWDVLRQVLQACSALESLTFGLTIIHDYTDPMDHMRMFSTIREVLETELAGWKEKLRLDTATCAWNFSWGPPS